MWQCLQTITDYKAKISHVADTDVLLPDKLNTFFARFEDNTEPPARPTPKDCGLSFSMADVSTTFNLSVFTLARLPAQTAFLTRVLRACAYQLAGVFTYIFNISLSQSAVLTRFKMFNIVPKKTKVTELNDNRPIALTSVIMKCFERLVKYHITSTLPDTLDPLQFAPIDPQTMRSPSHCTLPYPIRTRGIPM